MVSINLCVLNPGEARFESAPWALGTAADVAEGGQNHNPGLSTTSTNRTIDMPLLSKSGAIRRKGNHTVPGKD